MADFDRLIGRLALMADTADLLRLKLDGVSPMADAQIREAETAYLRESE